jgi:cell division protein FtsW
MIPGSFSRTDKSLLGRWWWNVDHWMLAMICLLIVIGALLSMAASPKVAERIGLDSFFFVRRHVLMLVPAIGLMISVSLLPIKAIRRLGWVMLIGSIFFLILTPFIGLQIKGARRWVNILGFSLQASEFVKPAFAIVAAWLFSRPQQKKELSGWGLSTLIYILLAGLILLQPDLGMTFVLTGVWLTQFFLAGLPMVLVGGLVVLGIIGLVGAYFLFPHVSSRVDRFLDPSAGDHYQINQSLEAFRNGGFLGQGPGEGIVKLHIPDAHADFVFSVAGEEFGFVLCITLLLLFAGLIARGFFYAYREKDLFPTLAITGIIMQLALQSLVNMASSLHLIPTKGMTLPFISYGGSSLLAMAIGMGMVLSFTRRDHQEKS